MSQRSDHQRKKTSEPPSWSPGVHNTAPQGNVLMPSSRDDAGAQSDTMQHQIPAPDPAFGHSFGRVAVFDNAQRSATSAPSGAGVGVVQRSAKDTSEDSAQPDDPQTATSAPLRDEQDDAALAHASGGIPDSFGATESDATGMHPIIQTKLTVSAPGDHYEREADQVADRVMRSSDSPTPSIGDPASVQRVQRTNTSPSAVSPAVETNIANLRGGGTPLPPTEQAFFSERIGADFSDVRIHTDHTATQTAESLNARAFTVGNNIAFNAGEYQPGTDSGRHLLAHELTHVIQQQGAAPIAQTKPQEQPNQFKVAQGQLTFDAEGTEGGKYHTRTIHWPGGNSGVTIGRGYDLGQHSARKIVADMVSVGISSSDAQRFAEAAGLKGADAQQFYKQHKDQFPQISPEQQNRLFSITYDEHIADVQRISNKKDTQAKYGTIDWAHLNPIIRDVLVDLRYRGDYTSATRKLVQPFAVKNDLKGLAEVMANREHWKNVPNDRFNRRNAYLQQALGRKPAGAQASTPKPAPQSTTTAAGRPADKAAPKSWFEQLVDDAWNPVQQFFTGEPHTTHAASHSPAQPPKTSTQTTPKTNMPAANQPAHPRAAAQREASGAAWVARFPTSTSTSDLEGDFRGNTERFIAALRSAGAAVRISATRRPAERAYLMHYAFKIAKEGMDPANVPPMEGVAIDWVHHDAQGAPDLAASRHAAERMVAAYAIVYAPALKSQHTRGLAIDMTITWSGTLSIVDGSGQTIQIATGPRDGAGNTELHRVGLSYGVHKLVRDKPHWSSDGH